MGPVFVTQALLPNLRKSKIKKVVHISTRQSQITRKNHWAGGYGYKMSKAALNMAMVTMNAFLKGEGFITVAVAPGWVKTDMGTGLAELSPEESIRDVKKLIESLTPEHNGGLWFHNGTRLSW